MLRRFQKVCADNGLPRLRVYDLRHSHASLLINEGVHPKKISERLGHSSIKLTMDTYGHLFEGSESRLGGKNGKTLRDSQRRRRSPSSEAYRVSQESLIEQMRPPVALPLILDQFVIAVASRKASGYGHHCDSHDIWNGCSPKWESGSPLRRSHGVEALR